MNRERLKMVRDRIAAEPPELLRMEYLVFDSECGKAHCIGGWANVIGENDKQDRLDFAQSWLELTHIQACELFFASSAGISPLDRLTQADALAALDSLIHADSDDALPIWPKAHP